MPHIIVCAFDFSSSWFRPTYRHVSLKPYLCSSRRIRSIKPVGLSIQKIKFGQIINGSSGFLPLLQFLQNHLILISEKINRHQIPPRSSVRISFKWKQNFLKTRIVSLNILPNCLQNDQIHVTDDRRIVLMRNLLPPGCPLSVFVPDFCLYFSPCFPFNLHSLATQCKISGSWTNHKHSATSLSSKKFFSFEKFDIMCEIRRLAEQFCFLPLIDLLEMQKCPKVEMIDWENWLRS